MPPWRSRSSLGRDVAADAEAAGAWLVYAAAAPWRYTSSPPAWPAATAAATTARVSGRGQQSGRRSEGATQQSHQRHAEHQPRDHQESLPRLFMLVEGPVAHHGFHALFLGLAAEHRAAGSSHECQGKHHRERPRRDGTCPATDCHEGRCGEDWQEERKGNGEVDDGGVERVR